MLRHNTKENWMWYQDSSKGFRGRTLWNKTKGRLGLWCNSCRYWCQFWKAFYISLWWGDKGLLNGFDDC